MQFLRDGGIRNVVTITGDIHGGIVAEYQPGDPSIRIDWRQSAKSDMVFVRQMEWEAAQSVWIWRDTSASMGWTSDRNHQSKRERADLLALALTALLMRGGEHVALLGAGLSLLFLKYGRDAERRAGLHEDARLVGLAERREVAGGSRRGERRTELFERAHGLLHAPD
mgnify:CR=1 FL=1